MHVIANFVPQYGLMYATGGASIYIMGATAFGNKYDVSITFACSLLHLVGSSGILLIYSLLYPTVLFALFLVVLTSSGVNISLPAVVLALSNGSKVGFSYLPAKALRIAPRSSPPTPFLPALVASANLVANISSASDARAPRYAETSAAVIFAETSAALIWSVILCIRSESSATLASLAADLACFVASSAY